jgi:Holliday junction DNA helicase RuvB
MDTTDPLTAWLIILAIVVPVFLIVTNPRRKKAHMIDTKALMRDAALAAVGGSITANVPKPKRGAAIFENSDSPRTWDAYIGQEKAKKLLRMNIKSAQFRKERMSHILIASAAPGVGKSALARLIGAELGVGVTEIQGTMNAERARALIGIMKDGDILVWDEFHQALNNGKAQAEWLLPLLQDGTMPGPEGLVRMPAVTIVAATTDMGCIPETILSRFPVRPVLENYSEDEYRTIARLASLSFFDKIGLEPLTDATLAEVATASASPRLMKNILANLRDCEIGGLVERDIAGDLDISETLEMMGLTRDGLDNDTVNYLLSLFKLGGGPVGIASLMASLGLQDRPLLTEAVLLQRGYLVISAAGRALTKAGSERVVAHLTDAGMLE